MLAEWTAFTEVRKFEVGRETMGGSATLVAVSDSYCEFRFNNHWSAGDVGWPIGLSLAGSLHIEPECVLRVQLWTTPGVVALGVVAWGVPAIGFTLALLGGLLTGEWAGSGSWLFGVCLSSVFVAISRSGARRFGEDAVKVASMLGLRVSSEASH
jgi:hypothetical protein